MELMEIEAINFASHSNTVLKFNNLPKILPIIGKNGSGKSSFFIDAPMFVLYGVTRDTDRSGVGIENTIKEGCDFCKVRIKFKINDNIYEIYRVKRLVKTGTQSEISFKINNKEQDGGIDDKQKLINDTIKLNYNAFTDIVLLEQNRGRDFIIKESSSDIFEDLFFIDVIKKVKKGFNDRKKELKKDIDTHKSMLYNDVCSISLFEINNKIKDNNDKLLQFKNILEKEEKRYYELISENDNKINEKKNIEKTNKESRDKINNIINKYKKDRYTINTKCNDKITKLSALKENCPVCLKALTKDDIKNVIDYFEHNRLEDIEKIKDNTRLLISEVRKNIRKDNIELDLILKLINESKDKITKLKECINKIDNNLILYSDKLNKVNRNNEINIKIKNYTDEINKCEKIVEFLDDKNIPLILAKKIFPVLEGKINQYLSMFNSDMSVSFYINKKNKPDIKILKNGKYRKYSTFSSGQQLRINLSTRLSVADLLVEVLGASIQTIILDEPLSSLDDEGRESFIEIINCLTSKYKNIILITHVDYIKSLFDFHITMEIDNNNSFISM